MIIKKDIKMGGFFPDFELYESNDPTKILLQEDTGKITERGLHKVGHTHTYIEINRPEDDDYFKILI